MLERQAGAGRRTLDTVHREIFSVDATACFQDENQAVYNGDHGVLTSTASAVSFQSLRIAGEMWQGAQKFGIPDRPDQQGAVNPTSIWTNPRW